MSNATVSALLDNLRVQLPGVVDTSLNLELYNICDDLAREALRVTAPTNVDADPSTWLPDAQWVPNYQALYHGVLARMFVQPEKPYTSLEQAKYHQEKYESYRDLARAEAAGNPTTVYLRLLSNLQTRVPLARDVTLNLEIYNTIDKIRREALRLPPLSDSDTTPSLWLPSTNWAQCYQAVLHGALANLYEQAGKPWAQPELVSEQRALYELELDLVRGENSSTPKKAVDRLFDAARTRLPGARDEIIRLEYFATAKEFLDCNIWQEDISLPIVAGTTNYDVVPRGPGQIIRLMWMVNKNKCPVYGYMAEPGELVLRYTPSNADTFTVTVAKSVTDPITRDGYPEFPKWILDRYWDVFVDGVIGKLMSQVGKPYSNPSMAVYHLRRFQNGRARARVDAQHANVYRVQSWLFPQTFQSRAQRGRR